jgi:hypothetical protein
MSINYTQVKLNECLRELDSLINFKHDNIYIERLINERVKQLNLEIKNLQGSQRNVH